MDSGRVAATLLIVFAASELPRNVSAQEMSFGCTGCMKRTFGYNQIWVPQQASPATAVQPLIACTAVASPWQCGMQPYAIGAATTNPTALYSAVPVSAEIEIVPAFRLCVACPGNASVIINGHPTQSTDRIREYNLRLPTHNQIHDVRLVVLQNPERVLWDGLIHAAAGGTQTVVVSQNRQSDPNAVSVGTQPPANQNHSLQESAAAMKSLESKIDKLIAIQPATLKKRARDLDKREM